MEYSEDYIYVKNHDVLSVWNKYRPLAMVYYKKVSVYIRHDLYDNGFDEWMQDVYIVYNNAMNGVKLDKIKNPESYSLYIQLSQYLHNFTTRDIVRDYTHNYTVKYMDYNESQDGESEFEWDSFLATEDIHSNLLELVKTLPPEFQERAEKIAFGQRTGGAKWPTWVKEYILQYYSRY
jgi:hypothetical protein